MDTPTLIGTGFVILGLFLWIFCAVYAYQHAPDFGRRPITWGILGIIFGPLALMAMYVLPKHEGAAHSGSTSSSASHKKDQYAENYEVPKKHKG